MTDKLRQYAVLVGYTAQVIVEAKDQREAKELALQVPFEKTVNFEFQGIHDVQDEGEVDEDENEGAHYDEDTDTWYNEEGEEVTEDYVADHPDEFDLGGMEDYHDGDELNDEDEDDDTFEVGMRVALGHDIPHRFENGTEGEIIEDTPGKVITVYSKDEIEVLFDGFPESHIVDDGEIYFIDPSDTPSDNEICPPMNR